MYVNRADKSSFIKPIDTVNFFVIELTHHKECVRDKPADRTATCNMQGAKA